MTPTLVVIVLIIKGVFRTDDNQRRRRQRRLAYARSAAKILTVIVITVILTLSCIRLGQAIATTSASTVGHNISTGNGSVAHDHGKLLTTTVSTMVDVTALNVSEDVLALRLREEASATESNIRIPETRPHRFASVERPRPIGDRHPITDPVRYYDRLGIGSLVPGSRSPRFIVRRNVIEEIRRRLDASNISKISDKNIETDVNVNMGPAVYRTNRRY